MFAEPPLCDEAEAMQALQSLSQPMDLLTMLYKVRRLDTCLYTFLRVWLSALLKCV
jgi:hypothetical protein